MKTYVIMLSKVFPKGHIREGEPTGFKEKLLSGEKIHTIRSNYELWKKRIDEVQNGDALISVRQWEDKPYRSKQIEIARFTKENGIGIEHIYIPSRAHLNFLLDRLHGLDKNDGLTRADWLSWFENAPIKQFLPIIHFTSFRYENDD